jgi:hypothetical protein
MTTRSSLFRAWCAQAWPCVLQTTQAMAGPDLTGQFTGCGPPQYPVVPVGWVHCTQWADEPRAVLTEVPPQAVPERLRACTPAELACLRVLRDRYQANRTPFTTRELAHLHFVRWLHQMGRVVR